MLRLKLEGGEGRGRPIARKERKKEDRFAQRGGGAHCREKSSERFRRRVSVATVILLIIQLRRIDKRAARL